MFYNNYGGPKTCILFLSIALEIRIQEAKDGKILKFCCNIHQSIANKIKQKYLLIIDQLTKQNGKRNIAEFVEWQCPKVRLLNSSALTFIVSA